MDVSGIRGLPLPSPFPSPSPPPSAMPGSTTVAVQPRPPSVTAPWWRKRWRHPQGLQRDPAPVRHRHPLPRPLPVSIVGAPRSCPLLHRRFREAMPPSSCPAFWPPSHPLVASLTRPRPASADGWVGRRGRGVRSPRARAGAAISSLTVPPTPACAPPRRILPLYADIDTNKACGLGLGDHIGSVPRHLPLVSRWRERTTQV